MPREDVKFMFISTQSPPTRKLEDLFHQGLKTIRSSSSVLFLLFALNRLKEWWFRGKYEREVQGVFFSDLRVMVRKNNPSPKFYSKVNIKITTLLSLFYKESFSVHKFLDSKDPLACPTCYSRSQ